LNFELYKDEKVRNGSLKAVFDALIFDSDARQYTLPHTYSYTHDWFDCLLCSK
jgi:hypothetical protein